MNSKKSLPVPGEPSLLAQSLWAHSYGGSVPFGTLYRENRPFWLMVHCTGENRPYWYIPLGSEKNHLR